MAKRNVNTPCAIEKERIKQKANTEQEVDGRLRLEARFGKHIRYYRKMHHYTQEELAIACNMHQNYISGIEAGKRNISLRAIDVLAKALGVPAKKLFD